MGPAALAHEMVGLLRRGESPSGALSVRAETDRCFYVCQGLGLFGDPISVVPGEMMFRRSLLGADKTGKGHFRVKGRLL